MQELGENLVRKGIILSSDLDGVQFDAPIPVKTLWHLLTRKFHLPDGIDLGEYQPPKGIKKLFDYFAVWHHGIRRLRPEGIVALKQIHSYAQESSHNLRVAVLSGREKNKHQLTIDRLTRSGYDDYCEGRYHLNLHKSASAWKEFQVQEWVNQGHYVIHLEDDLKAALRVARVDAEKVQVYLFKNLSNHEFLLRWAKVALPKNVILVKGFKDIPDHYRQRFLTAA